MNHFKMDKMYEQMLTHNRKEKILFTDENDIMQRERDTEISQTREILLEIDVLMPRKSANLDNITPRAAKMITGQVIRKQNKNARSMATRTRNQPQTHIISTQFLDMYEGLLMSIADGTRVG